MNPMLDLLRSLGKKGFSTSKLAVFLISVVLAGALVWFTAPWIVSLHFSAIPRLWSAVRSSSASPYLFFAVNFIILTIWKLSENRTLHADQCAEEESDSLCHHLSVSLKPRDLGTSLPLPHLSKLSPENHRKSPSISAANAEKTSPMVVSESSCVTNEYEEHSTASSPSAVPAASDSALPVLGTEEEEQTALDESGENDSLDATWKAIINKSDTWERSPLRAPVESPAASKRSDRVPASMRDRDAFSEGNDEMNQRFDDFIKKNYDQIRLRKPGEANHRWRIK